MCWPQVLNGMLVFKGLLMLNGWLEGRFVVSYRLWFGLINYFDGLSRNYNTYWWRMRLFVVSSS